MKAFAITAGTGITRRHAVALNALSTASYRRVLGAKERIQVGVIGFGLIGCQHVQPWTRALRVSGSSDEQFDPHMRNSLDCIKRRERPTADVEGGHQATTACHLANISLRTGRKIRWDADKEEILANEEASAVLVRPYRKPWNDVLAKFT